MNESLSLKFVFFLLTLQQAWNISLQLKNEHNSRMILLLATILLYRSFILSPLTLWKHVWILFKLQPFSSSFSVLRQRSQVKKKLNTKNIRSITKHLVTFIILYSLKVCWIYIPLHSIILLTEKSSIINSILTMNKVKL